MRILRKTFDDDTSGIEVHDGDTTYRFQIEGDTAVYLGEDSVPQSVQDEVKNQGYASSVAYDVPGSIKEYVDANAGGGGGSGTATEVELPTKGSGSALVYKDENGNTKLVGNSESSGKSASWLAGSDSGEGFTGARLSLLEGDAIVGPSIEMKSSNADGSATISIEKGQGIEVISGGSRSPLVLVSTHLRMHPEDVTAISSPQQGAVAYNDGTTGTEGPAFYDGSAWKSLVDGNTIS